MRFELNISNRINCLTIASGKKTDATQEMFALGVATIAGSFFGAYPISASFGRSSVQYQSGVKTTLSNIYAGNLSSSVKWNLSRIQVNSVNHRYFGPIRLGFPDAFASLHSKSCPRSGHHNISYIHGRIWRNHANVEKSK